MTSDDTHELTLKLLEENKFFGMSRSQLTIMKQEKVPSLLDVDAHFALKPNCLEIDTKPHGHGDVHTLLYQTSLVRKWKDEGRQWVIFFQDTNPLIFRSVPAVLGISKLNNFEVNSITVPRKIGEAVGAICTLTKPNEKPLTVNVEYNQLGGLFKDIGGEQTDDLGYSIYPGNINCLVFAIPEYLETLNATQGCIAEFINPKYADSTKTTFKTPTRLECMMQDYPKLLKTNDRIGVTQIDKRFCFSACKNDVVSAAQKWKQGLPAESASSCEFDFFKVHEEILKIVGVDIEPGKETFKNFAGIEYKTTSKIVLAPKFGVTLKEIRNKFKGKNFISSESSLVLDGDIKIENLYLDGSLWIKSNEKRDIKNLEVKSKNYVSFEPLNAKDNESVAEHLKIRGYQGVGLDGLTQI
jgi:UDP-sugar pyrophosphorylase